MANDDQPTGPGGADLTLVVRRLVRSTPERLFEAWTTPELLRQWWGPDGVDCSRAEVDLRVGGAYRIANRMPDGSVIWIGGRFERITPPSELVYSWNVEHIDAPPQRVMVRFQRRGDGTEIIVLHERISDAATRDDHQRGWIGCLDGLARFVETPES